MGVPQKNTREQGFDLVEKKMIGLNESDNQPVTTCHVGYLWYKL